ncbi:hypothetical protein D5F01_LYC20610 [Larimichthys crocea]|uniref:Fish-egg lectin n=1 Tax=Larimichthys crocea TaxID=215358 RepID=A0A6G0HRA8_LARCR|nr:uncharacterized protein LOC104922661 [Larimichthys crocea]KAE8281617.1 hypothetical protein D5F01_LYC20610 [Larimichthys crocea]
MKAVTAFFLVLCYLAVNHAWNCKESPRLNNALQIDAGQGKVVAIDRSYYMYFLMGSRWYRMSTLKFKHATVGPAGLWAASTRNRVYKSVGGQLRPASGLSMQQLDAGGDDQVVGVASNSRTYCLTRSRASSYYGVGTLSWSYLSRVLRYYSCGLNYGCWGVDSSYRVMVTQVMNPASCAATRWAYVSGPKMRMVEVGTYGRVFAVSITGLLYERVGISSSRRMGTAWRQVPMCSTVRHVSYDLRQLWVVTNSGLIMRCTH